MDTAINPNFETMKPEIPGSELSNFGSLLHTLPSLQYPVGTFAPMSRVEGDFSIHSRANSPTPFQNFMSLSSDSRRRLPKPGALHSTNHSNVPMLLLADGVGPTRSNIFPHQKWADDQSYSWKDDSDHSKEALVKKALYKERSDELKASVQLNQKGYQQAFPLKLFDLVTEQNNEIIGWVPEGNAFKVRHMENFVNIILPAYFKRK